MAQLRLDYLRFKQQRAEILAIGPEDAPSFCAFWTKEHLPFIGLPDPTQTVLDLYGQQVNVFKLGRMPAQVLIDRSGLIRSVHYGRSMADIPTTEESLTLLRSL